MEEQLQQILVGVLSENNDERQQYEDLFWQLAASDPNSVVVFLLSKIEDISQPKHQILSLIFLKLFHRLENIEMVQALSPEVMELVQNKILNFFANATFPQQNIALLSSSCALIASVYISQNLFQNFLPDIFGIISSCDPSLKAPAIDCVVQVMNAFNDKLQFDMSIVVQTLNSIFSSPPNLISVLASLRLLYTVLPIDCEAPEELLQFLPVIPQIIPQLTSEYLSTMLLNLAVFITKKSQYIQPISEDLLQLTLQIAADKAQTEASRLNAIEVISHIVHYVLDREHSSYLQSIVEVFMQIISDPDDITCSHTDDEATIGCIANNILSFFGELENIQPEYTSIIMGFVGENIDSEEWNICFASLKALDSIIYSASKYLSDNVNEIFDSILKHFVNEQVICRVAAFYAFAQACSAFKDHLQTVDNGPVISAFLEIIPEETDEDCLAAEIFSLSVYCENNSIDFLQETFEPVMSILIGFIESATPIIANAVLRCISIYMRSLKLELNAFFPGLTQWLKEIIQSDEDDSISLLRARAIEAFGYIDNCVDNSDFTDDIIWFVETMIQANWEELSLDEVDQTQQALSRIVEARNKEFPDIVVPVVQKLLENVQKKPVLEEHSQYDPELSTINKDKLVVLFDSNFVEIPKANKNVFESALNALGVIMNSVGEHFCPFVSDFCSAAATACLWFYFPDTQIAALGQLRQCLTFSMTFMTVHSQEFILHMFRAVFNMFERTIYPTALKAIFETLSFGLSKLNQLPKTDQTFSIVSEVLQHMPKAIEVIRRSDEAYTKGEQIEEAMSTVFMILFDNFTQQTDEFFDQHLRELLPIETETPSVLTLNCWTSFVKSIETPDPNLVALVKSCLIQSCQSDNFVVAASAFFCLASLIDQGSFEDGEIDELVGLAFHQLEIYDQQGEIAKQASDGAVYMLNNVINTTEEPNPEIVQAWFLHLPFVTSPEKSKWVYLTLTDILAQDTLVINEENIYKLIEIVSIILDCNLVDSEMEQRFKTYLKEILLSNSATNGVVQAAISQLDEDKQSKLNTLLSD